MYFKQGLEALYDFFIDSTEDNTIFVPFKIGCGLAKGIWSNYESMLKNFEKELKSKGVKIELVVCSLQN